ncbi:MAG: hypothetical protein L0Z50_17355, partial [Verrucomicrobiales bacterium]|nr:hypothetical protein [Verrucomicrobiales bacterium]
ITKANQSLFAPGPLAVQIVTSETSLANLGWTASSGLGVTYEVISGPAQIVGQVLQVRESGEVVLRVRQIGDQNHAPAETSVRLPISLRNALSRISAPVRLPNGRFQFGVEGQPNSAYGIEVCDQTFRWQHLAGVKTDSNGRWQFTDFFAPSASVRFYRLRRP